MKKLFLLCGFAVCLTFALPAQAETLVNVKGMVCDFCAQSLKKVFNDYDAVDHIDVNLDDQTVTVHYKEGADGLSDEEIEKAITWAGYDLVGIEHEQKL